MDEYPSNDDMELYKWLYQKLGGRPFTYRIRQFSVRNVWVMGILGVVVSGLLGKILSVSVLTIVGLSFLAGLLAGHFWWDTKGPYLGR